MLLNTYKEVLSAFVILTVLVLLIIFFYTRSILEPVEKIKDIIERIFRKEYNHNLLSQSRKNKNVFFNLSEISQRLRRYQDKISVRKEGFFTLLDAIQQPVWIQNNRGIITVGNESFEKIFNAEDAKGHYFWNVIRQKELYSFIDEIFNNPRNVIMELQCDENYFLCVASFLQASEQTVFILNDITEIRKLENIKKDFVLNVSHELRTPLTSIKGYLEMMGSTVSEKNKQYFEIIKRNTERLIKIVEDLLSLSKLEYIQKIKPENIDIKEFMENIGKVFAVRCLEKNLEMKINISKNLIYMTADLFQMEQVFINLIDNAVKYTEKGVIAISFSKEYNYLRIEISDTGTGIPEEHLSRLFERFYVVDKSRSRKMGGTGLGLSIVKHIVGLHEGEISVESKIGKWTKFTILLPN